MGSAIAERIKEDYEVFVFDKEKAKIAALHGIAVKEDIKSLAEISDIILLAIKPQDFDAILGHLRGLLKDKIIISIAAGISTGHIEKKLGDCRVIRVMPNLAAKIGESVSCLCKGKFACDEDLDLAEEIFYYLGVVRKINENLMNAATAISGSGPAYVFYFIENAGLDENNIPEHARHEMMLRLEKAAQGVGFSREDAAFLSANTINSAINLLHKTKIKAAELRKQVTSKGGTTEAAIAVLTKSGTWEEAAKAALKRAEELAKGVN